MTPVIFTGAPDIEHGGNLPLLPRQGFLGRDALRNTTVPLIYSVRGPEDVPIYGAALIVEDATGERAVLHTSDDVESWLAAGWRITSY